MPELPEVTVYVERTRALIMSHALQQVRLIHPFVLRSVEPKLEAFRGRVLTDVTRMDKRIVLAYQGGLFMVVHLMSTGRLHWRQAGTLPRRRVDLAVLDFPSGSLLLTEAGTKRRASLYLVSGVRELDAPTTMIVG